MADFVPRHLRIFISSPGDVADERSIARQVIEQLPYNPFVRGKITTEVIAWDKPGGGAPLLATMTPQEAINDGLPKPSECNVVVVVFWSRMGTPLVGDLKKTDGSAYQSGTEWEYEDAVQMARKTAKPVVLLYRRTEEVALKPTDPAFLEKYEQWKRVEAFFDQFRDSKTGGLLGGYNTYQKPDDFRTQFESHLETVIRRLLDQAEAEATSQEAAQESAKQKSAPSQTPKQVIISGSPFPGLRAFTPRDKLLFFGRGRETDALLENARHQRFVAVVGASGSGKSSLVGAGLLPRLKGYGLPGSQDWLLPDWEEAKLPDNGDGPRGQWVGLRFTPGEFGDGNPFTALAAKLLPMIGGDQWTIPRLAAELASEPGRLLQLIDGLMEGKPSWVEALIFVDQFEELFVSVKSDWRAPFIEMLARAAASMRLRLIVTLRADFYQQAVGHPRLAQLLENGSFPLSAPGLNALQEMINRPAAMAGLEFEEGLADQILADTGSDPGALPLLAYALDELYKRCQETGRLTFAAYNGPSGLGGIAGAIASRAEGAFDPLPAEVQAALAPVFRDLVEINENGAAGRRRALLSQAAATPRARELVEALTRANLLVRSRDASNQPVVEVAHEALLDHWPRLTKSLEQDRDFLRWRHHFSDDVDAWNEHKRNPSYLYRGLRLAEADDWDKRYPGELGKTSDNAPAFLQSSRRRRRAVRGLQWGTIAVVIIAALAVLIVQVIQSQSERATKQAASSPLISFPASRALLGQDNHPAQIGAFSLDQYEVSTAEYRLCVSAGVCLRPLEPSSSQEFETGDRNLPVTWVSAYQAYIFCRWIGRRLPTSGEWERAARGTDGRQWPWSNATPAPGQVNLSIDIYPDNVPQSAAPVDLPAFQAGNTPEGVTHMLGNVREWTQTPTQCNDTGSCTANWDASWDGSQNTTLVIRDDGWATTQLNAEQWGNPLTVELPGEANYADIDLGFRCATS